MLPGSDFVKLTERALGPKFGSGAVWKRVDHRGHEGTQRKTTDTKTGSSFPRVEDADSRPLKVGYIPGRDGQTVYQGCGCDEGVTIGTRVRYVKRRASLGDVGINRKDTAGECGQHVTIHPGTKDRALLFVTPVDKEDSDLQFQY